MSRSRSEAPLRILFVSQEYPPETGWGGIGSYVACLAPALVERGHEVHVLSCVAGQGRSDADDRGVQVHRRGAWDARWLRWVRRRLRVPVTAERVRGGISAFREYRRLGVDFDVVEIPDWGAEGWVLAAAGRTALAATLHTPLPVIARYNGMRIRPRDLRWASWLEHLALRRADVVTSPSRHLVESLEGFGWLKGKAVEVIPNPIDWQRWGSVADVAQTPPSVLFVGRLDPLKSPETLVEAVWLLGREIEGVQGVLVGKEGGKRDGVPYGEWLRGTVRGADRCLFTDHVPRTALVDVYAGCRVFALPSRFENYPMAALEAMAAGRPVVVNRECGLAEFVERAGAGAVAESRDAAALAKALRPFLADAGHAAEVGEKARRSVREELDPGRIAGLRESLYRRIAKQRGARK